MSTREIASPQPLTADDGGSMRHNPRAAQIVISIGEFMGREAPPPSKRYVVAEDTASPADGRKLLETWLTIRSRVARQSVMDALVAIAERDPE